MRKDTQMIALSIVVVPIGIVLGFIAQAYQLSILWNLFLVPIGIPELSGGHIIGISMILRVMMPESEKDKSNEDKELSVILMTILLKPIISTIIVVLMANFFAQYV